MIGQEVLNGLIKISSRLGKHYVSHTIGDAVASNLARGELKQYDHLIHIVVGFAAEEVIDLIESYVYKTYNNYLNQPGQSVDEVEVIGSYISFLL